MPIDLTGAEERFARDLQSNETPERIFDRQWALTIVTQACDQLQDSLIREGKGNLFHHLRAFLPGGGGSALIRRPRRRAEYN
jgi:hypothetical protein